MWFYLILQLRINHKNIRLKHFKRIFVNKSKGKCKMFKLTLVSRSHHLINMFKLQMHTTTLKARLKLIPWTLLCLILLTSWVTHSIQGATDTCVMIYFCIGSPVPVATANSFNWQSTVTTLWESFASHALRDDWNKQKYVKPTTKQTNILVCIDIHTNTPEGPPRKDRPLRNKLPLALTFNSQVQAERDVELIVQGWYQAGLCTRWLCLPL